MPNDVLFRFDGSNTLFKQVRFGTAVAYPNVADWRATFACDEDENSEGAGAVWVEECRPNAPEASQAGLVAGPVSTHAVVIPNRTNVPVVSV